jgi:hypothetical protein
MKANAMIDALVDEMSPTQLLLTLARAAEKSSDERYRDLALDLRQLAGTELAVASQMVLGYVLSGKFLGKGEAE